MENLKKFHQKSKQSSPYSVFCTQKLRELVFEKKLEFNEAMRQIADEWNKMDETARSKFDRKKDDNKSGSKEAEREPMKLKIKHTFKDTGLKLDGYVFFAQKQRQILAETLGRSKKVKVSTMMAIIREKWNGLSGLERH